jgi:hypothetical protein
MNVGKCRDTGQRWHPVNDAVVHGADPAVVANPDWRTRVYTLLCLSRPWLLGQAVNRIAALGAGLVGADLADALEDLDRDALLGETGKETADRVWRPAHRLSDLWPRWRLRYGSA